MYLRKSANDVVRYLTVILLLSVGLARGQTQTTIFVKTLDRKFTPIPKLGVSIDGQPFFFTSETGTVYTEANVINLPPKTVVLSDEQLEAESWNYNKGTLEIIVRKKTYKIIKATVKDKNENLIRGIKVTYNAAKPVEATTDASGSIQVPVPLDEILTRQNLFSVEGHKIVSIRFSGANGIVVAEATPRERIVQKQDDVNTPPSYSIDDLDSIRSLTMFYVVLKDLEIQKLSKPLRKKIDAKFFELVDQRDDSLNHRLQRTLFGTVANSSMIKSDIEFLGEQALAEKQFLAEAQQNFTKNIAAMKNKLRTGGANLSESERNSLLLALQNLDKILKSNEEQFYQNQASYGAAFSSLRNSLMNIQDLENQLSDSETQRLRESQAFRQKTIITLSTIVGLMVAVFVLFYLTQKFTIQKKELAKANSEVKRVNENLEDLVAQRTKMLAATNKELDTFLYRSSHDLKRPLTTIMGLANIAKHTLEAPAIDLFEKTALTAREMDRLLQKLKMVSTINHPTDEGVIDFPGEINGVLDEFQDFIKSNKINVNYTIGPGLNFFSFPSVIKIILKNIIENALFFSTLQPDKIPQVDVRLHQTNSKLDLVVHDNGVGIPAEFQSQIWDMFFVGHEKSKGNGLGLYITRKAVNTLSGEITLRSIENKFTEFIVSLPNPRSDLSSPGMFSGGR